MTNRADTRNREFIVTSQGVSATRWLAFVLASNPKVFVAHGHFPIDSIARSTFDKERTRDDKESLRIGNQSDDFYQNAGLDEVFATYRKTYPNAVACGNVHSYTLDGLLQQHPDELAKYAVANVVRHPISYVESHTRLVRKSEPHPAIYDGYAANLFPAAVRSVPELLLIDCPDYREFLAFVVSCYSVLQVDRDLSHEKFKHFRMETLTSEPKLLKDFCKNVTGLNYSLTQLEAFINKGPINRHRRAKSKTDPLAIYQDWPHWKRDIVALMLADATLKRFENLDYDVAMLREPSAFKAAGPRDAAPCLADALNAMDENHPLLMKNYPPPVTATNAGTPLPSNASVQLLESLAGYNLVRSGEHVYAIRQAVGKVDVTVGPQALLEQYGPEDLMVADTPDAARTRIELKILSRRLEAIEADRQRFVEIDKRTYNLEELQQRLFHIEQLQIEQFVKLSETGGSLAAEVRGLQSHIQKLSEANASIANEALAARNQLNQIRVKTESINSTFEQRLQRFAEFDRATGEELSKLTTAVESNSSLIKRVEAAAEQRLLETLRVLDTKISSVEQEVQEYRRSSAKHIDKIADRIDADAQSRQQVEEQFRSSQESLEGLLVALSGNMHEQIDALKTRIKTLQDTMDVNNDLNSQFERRLSALAGMLAQQTQSTDDRIAGLATLLEIQVAAADQQFAERIDAHEHIAARIAEIASLTHELQSAIEGFRRSPVYRTLQSLYLVSPKPTN
jgi:hypothetical protein